MKEARNATIDLPEDDPCIVTRVLLFLYTDDYPISKIAELAQIYPQFKTVTDHYNIIGDGDQDWRRELELHTLMYAAGRKFGIDDLCDMSRELFLRAEYGSVKDNRLPSKTELAALTFNDYDAKICRLVYSTTPPIDRGLRDIVVYDMQVVVAHPREGDRLAIDLIRTFLELAIDMATMKLGQKKLNCTRCRDPARVLTWPCQSHGWIDCESEDCAETYKDRGFCALCCKFGVVEWSDKLPDDFEAW